MTNSAYIWVNAQRKKIDIRGMDNHYLKQVAKFVSEGGGYDVSAEQIKAIYDELENRGLTPKKPLQYALDKWDERRGMVDNEMLDAGDYHT